MYNDVLERCMFNFDDFQVKRFTESEHETYTKTHTYGMWYCILVVPSVILTQWFLKQFKGCHIFKDFLIYVYS